MTEQPHLHTFIPHRPPMVMLDELVQAGDEAAHCRVTIRDDNIFYDAARAGVPAWIGIEMMAQSIAAGAGHQAWSANVPAPIGFLLGSRRYETETDLFPLGATLDVYAVQEMESSGMAMFDCRIEWQGRRLAACKLNVYRPPAGDLDALLKKGVA